MNVRSFRAIFGAVQVTPNRECRSRARHRHPRGALRLLIWASFIVLIAQSARAQDAHIQKGLALIREGNYAAALPEFELAEHEHPRNPAIENILGIINTKLGDTRSANQHYHKAILLDPQLEEPHKNLGFSYLTQKQYGPSEEQLKIALSLRPADGFAHYYLALDYLATGQDQEAFQQLPSSREPFENDPKGSLEMAEACLRLNQTSAAAPLLRRLLRSSAISPSQEYQLALLLFKRQQYAQAVTLFRRMAAAQPSSWIDKYNLAIGLLRAGQPAEAASVLVPLSAQRPGDANVLSLLGAAYEADAKPAKALSAYDDAIRADPANPDRYLDYTRLLMTAGRYRASEQLIADGLQHAPDSYALEVRLGSIRMMQGQYAEARDSFQKAILRDPDVPLAYVALAQAYSRLEQNQEALSVLARAQRRLPDRFVLEYFYSQALLRSDETAEATRVLRHAVTLKPGVPEGHFLLGKAYFKSHRLTAARSEFERALQLSPRDSNACFELARIYSMEGLKAKARQMSERMAQLKHEQYNAALRAQDALLTAVGAQAPAR